MEFKEIINGCLKNDIRCQEKLFKLNYGSLMTVALRMSPNREIAEDMLQESYIKIFKNIGTAVSFEPSQFYGWCKRILSNTIIDYHRRNKTIEIQFNESFDLPYEDDGYANDYLESKNVTPQKIISRLQKLPPKYNLVFNLHVIDGYSHPEISEMLNINVGTSKSNLSKAKSRLRKELTSN